MRRKIVNFIIQKKGMVIKMTNKNRLALYLKEKRLSHGGRGYWSLRAIADRAKISNAYLSQLESGQCEDPSPNILKKISEAMNLSYMALMEVAGYVEQIEKPDDKC